LSQLAKHLGFSRQSHYQWRKRSEEQHHNHALLLELIRRERKLFMAMGGRKLYYRLKPEMQRLGLKLGRDAFFKLLRSNGLLAKKKRRYVTTTNSLHEYRTYKNHLYNRRISRIDEAYGSDITYLHLQDNRVIYLSLVMDLYSRKILGWSLSKQQRTDLSLEALNQAVRGKSPTGIIHHSDRGTQYCSDRYRERLESLGMQISHSAAGNPYENAKVERVIGTLKHEFGLTEKLPNFRIAKAMIKETIKLYNTERPHLSLNYQVPAAVYDAGRE
jgi:transposase InsO family protein